MTDINITPTSDFSAEWRGPKLAGLNDPAVWESIRETWARYPVLSFPDQPLTHEDLETVTQQFGEFGIDPYLAPIEGHPHIIEVRRNADEKAKPFAADAWHSDWSFLDHPPAGTMLHGKIIPPVGGETLFCDCAAAYDALSEGMKRMLSGMNGVHSAILGYSNKGLFAQDKHERSMTIITSDEAEGTQLHPIVRVHPVTGRKTLFVNPTYTIGIEDMTPLESQAILGFLALHMTQEQFIHRHKWAENTLLLWDNRTVLHAASGGYDGHERVLHRTTIAGDAVIAA